MKIAITLVLFVTIFFSVDSNGAQSFGNAFKNPFVISSMATTTITVSAAGTPCSYQIKIYDLRGRLVKSYKQTTYSTLDYSVNWDGKNKKNRFVKSGIYFVIVVREYQNTSLGSDKSKFRLGVIRKK